MPTLENDSRVYRAIDLLKIDDDATAESLADAIWLARVLPREENDTSPPVVDNKHQNKTDTADQKKQTVPDGNKPLSSTINPRRGDKSGIFPPQPGKTDDASQRATFITVPAADSLPNRLALERALKPFLKKFPSRRLKQLNSDLTAQASADRRAVTPVFEPLAERWFDVLLLVERTDAMEVWSDTVRELHTLLGRHGAFRTVRLVRFSVTAGAVSLFTTANQPLSSGVARDPDGRRLCLFLTNGTSMAWREGSLIDFVRGLGRLTVVAFIQMLPRRAWAHTALGAATKRLHSSISGAPNAALHLEDPFSGQLERMRDVYCVPALTLEAQSVALWASFVMSPRRSAISAIRLLARAPGAPGAKTRSSEERLATFRSVASPEAYQLLRVLAGVPLMTLPIMRLVQQSASRSREQFHLAEVMLSGLIERVTPADSKTAADEVFYEFIPEVSNLLIDTLSSGETRRLDEAMRPIQERLVAFIESQSNTAIRSFRALLSDPQGLERLPSSARAFVAASRRIYERRGILSPVLPQPPPELKLQIEPHVLLEETPNMMAGVSGSGMYIAAASGPERRWIRTWNRATGELIGERSLSKPLSQLLVAPDSDQMFIVSEGFLIPLISSLPPVQPVTLPPLEGGVFDISPDASAGYAANTTGFFQWNLQDAITTQPLETGIAADPTVITAGGGTIVIGYADGSVFCSRSEVTFDAGASVISLLISRDGYKILVQGDNGKVCQLDTRTMSSPEYLPMEDSSSIAMGGDGLFAAVGHWSGLVSIWDLTRSLQIAELKHGEDAAVVSLSASGAYAISSSDDGLRWWDLSALVAAIVPPAERKALQPRDVSLVGEETKDGLKKAVHQALVRAGHTVRLGFEGSDYIVLIAQGSVKNPYIAEALSIGSLDQLPQLLDELDREPPGSLYNLPPVPVNMIARPEVEKGLRAFIRGLQAGDQVTIRVADDPSQAGYVHAILRTDETRRLFPGGIYWKDKTAPGRRRGRCLIIIPRSVVEVPDNEAPALEVPALEVSTSNAPADEVPPNKVPPSTMYAPPQAVVLQLNYDHAVSPDDAFFNIPALSEAEVAAHLREAGMNEAQLTASRSFHREINYLVSLAAGAFRLRIELKGSTSEAPYTAFLRGCALILEALDEAAKEDMIRFSALLPGNLEQGRELKPSTVEAATNCGWLEDHGGEVLFTFESRNAVAELFPEEVRAAHERVCLAYESSTSDMGSRRIGGLAHAELAGGIARVEKFLRHRYVLAECVRYTGPQLTSLIQPIAVESTFLQGIVDALAATPSAVIPIERLDGLLAPPPQWPARSGVADARAQGFQGDDIRILLPANGCERSHPEFLERSFPALRSSSSKSASSSYGGDQEGTRKNGRDYGTGLCSVIGGLHIGIAPEAIIEPVDVLDKEMTITAIRFRESLEKYLSDPPDILCLILGFQVYGKPDTSLRSIIKRLVERDVLVIAAAGNDGPDRFSEPGISPEVLSVGFCDFEDRIAEQSSRGVYSGSGKPRTVPDLYGYGVDVNTAVGIDSYTTSTGSAYACAYVAGIAALYAEATGVRGAALRQLLIQTADPETKVARFALDTLAA